MYYSIRHQTKFRYSHPVSESIMELRLQPRTEWTQHCLSFEIATALLILTIARDAPPGHPWRTRVPETPRQILAVMVGSATLIAVGVGAWMWTQAPDYRVLYSGLTDRDGGAVISALNQMNVPYRFAEGGGVHVGVLRDFVEPGVAPPARVAGEIEGRGTAPDVRRSRSNSVFVAIRGALIRRRRPAGRRACLWPSWHRRPGQCPGFAR